MHRLPNSLSRITRRTTLGGITAGTALATFPLRASVNTQSSFRHGVASGDPDATSVVVWTRITASGNNSLRCEIALDRAFTRIVKVYDAETGPERDHTVKLLAKGLEAGTTYYYRFRLNDEVSPIGRAKTLPIGSIDSLGIALASCSNFAFGHFNAYEAMAHDPAIDFVLHTGDYIYEYGHDGWGDDIARTIGRRHDPAHEIVSLSDYRRRHAQYKSDAGSQAMHAAHSFIACWDDHESANNPWVGGAENHQPEKEGEWITRREAAVQAYYEWMPVREPEWLGGAPRNRLQFWRSYSFGNLATLSTIETRHTARAEQLDFDALALENAGREEIDRFRREILEAPGRRMISEECETDLRLSLNRSVEMGQPWRLIGNAIPIARTELPDLVALGVMPDPFVADPPYRAEALKNARILAGKGRAGLPFYSDTWDGYPWARERLYDLSREAGAADLIFLTGDSHSFWANRLYDRQGRPVGVELGTAGITSPGDFVGSGFGDKLSRALDHAFAEHIPEILWTDNMHQGYVRLDLSPRRAKATFIAVDNISSRDFRPFIANRFLIERTDEGIDFVR